MVSVVLGPPARTVSVVVSEFLLSRAPSPAQSYEAGNGAEAWRRLCWEYEPDLRVRHGAVLHSLLRREFGKDQKEG